MTLECSRCHDHKYDPISQREFYQLFSFFNNVDESGQTSHFTDSMPVPTLLLSDEKTDRLLADLGRRIRDKEAEWDGVRAKARGGFNEWLKARPSEPVLTGLVGDYAFEAFTSNKVLNLAHTNKPAEVFEDPKWVSGKVGHGLALSGENGVVCKGVGAFSRVDPFSISLWVNAPGHPARAVIAHRSRAALDAGSRGYELLLEKGRVSAGLTHMWPHNAIKVTSKVILPTNQWVHVAMTYDGSSRAAGLKLYWNGQPVEVEVVRDHLFKDILYERVEVELALGHRFRDNGFKGGQVDELKVFDRALTPVEVAHLSGNRQLAKHLAAPAASLSQAQQEQLFDYYCANFEPLCRQHQEELRALRLEQSKTINPIPEVMAMEEMLSARPAHVLKRGAYDAPAERVSAGTPVNLLPFGEGLPRNRLGLAQWLLSPDQPLTARVTVNRYWQMFFGKGLVATADNFGSQGELPTHPELLDWLAVRFRETGWDVKALVRLLVTSATYRQSSQTTPELLTKDPENQLLARGPRHRLSAEMIRDNALAASGLLVRRVGGPSVKPYQPEGLWEEKSGAKYEPDKGEGLYRRSLYTFWKRTIPHPAMIAFDAAERNVCIVRRQSTSTPLQALVLLNDPQFVEAARLIVERMLKEGGPAVEDRIAYAFRLLTSRRPSVREAALLKQLYQEQAELFQQSQEETGKLMKVGAKSNDTSLDAVELAAGTALASALLNFDETVMKR
jgi:hypothetical protein